MTIPVPTLLPYQQKAGMACLNFKDDPLTSVARTYPTRATQVRNAYILHCITITFGTSVTPTRHYTNTAQNNYYLLCYSTTPCTRSQQGEKRHATPFKVFRKLSAA